MMSESSPPVQQEKKSKRILITGSKGRVGKVLTKSLAEDFEIVELDISRQDNAETKFAADISNLALLEKTFNRIGHIDTIVHLAANPNENAPWEEIYPTNILGLHNVYECAKEYGVKRVIFASSTHLYGAYEGYPTHSPLGRPIEPDDEPRPDSDYGSSKGFGELTARQYYDKFGIKTICIRIGAVADDDKPVSPYDRLYLSHHDLADLVRQAILTDIPFGIYFATSENKNMIFSISSAKKDLDYEPKDGV